MTMLEDVDVVVVVFEYCLKKNVGLLDWYYYNDHALLSLGPKKKHHSEHRYQELHQNQHHPTKNS